MRGCGGGGVSCLISCSTGLVRVHLHKREYLSSTRSTIERVKGVEIEREGVGEEARKVLSGSVVAGRFRS